jgi:hypothetical protein
VNAAQLLAKLDACAVDGSLASDCRRVLGQEASAIRALIGKVEEYERREAAARLRPGCSHAALGEYADDARVARERLGSAIREAQRVMALWGVGGAQ